MLPAEKQSGQNPFVFSLLFRLKYIQIAGRYTKLFKKIILSA